MSTKSCTTTTIGGLCRVTDYRKQNNSSPKMIVRATCAKAPPVTIVLKYKYIKNTMLIIQNVKHKPTDFFVLLKTTFRFRSPRSRFSLRLCIWIILKRHGCWCRTPPWHHLRSGGFKKTSDHNWQQSIFCRLLPTLQHIIKLVSTTTATVIASQWNYVTRQFLKIPEA